MLWWPYELWKKKHQEANAVSDKQQTTPEVTGYRKLTPEEIALINEIKAMEGRVLALVESINDRNSRTGISTRDESEVDRLIRAEPFRWSAIARTDFQTGFMALTRAVAQPIPLP